MHQHILLWLVVLPILIETFHQDWLHTNWGKNMYLFFFVEYHLNNIYLIFYIIIFLIDAIFHNFWSTKLQVNIFFFWKLINILYLSFVNIYFSIDNVIKVTVHRVLKNYYMMSLSFFKIIMITFHVLHLPTLLFHTSQCWVTSEF